MESVPYTTSTSSAGADVPMSIKQEPDDGLQTVAITDVQFSYQQHPTNQNYDGLGDCKEDISNSDNDISASCSSNPEDDNLTLVTVKTEPEDESYSFDKYEVVPDVIPNLYEVKNEFPCTTQTEIVHNNRLDVGSQLVEVPGEFDCKPKVHRNDRVNQNLSTSRKRRRKNEEDTMDSKVSHPAIPRDADDSTDQDVTDEPTHRGTEVQPTNCSNVKKQLSTKNRKQNKHQCVVCEKDFKWKYDLKSHMQLQHGSESDTDPDVTDESSDSETDVQPTNCSGVKKKLSTKNIKRKKHQCFVCEKGFKWKYDLKSHMQLQHGGESDTTDPDVTDESSDCETDVQPTNCRSVKKKLSTKNIKRKKHPCFMCEKVFKWKYSLKSHMQIQHGGETDSTDSDVTDESSDSGTDVQPTNYSNGDKQPSTKIRKLIKTDPDVTDEPSGHGTDVQPTNCTNVNKQLSTKIRKLIRYQCVVCEKGFQWKCLLKRHMQRRHSDERDITDPDATDVQPTNCSNVKKQLSTKDRKQKSHQCVVCEKDFKWKYDLRSHMQLQHSGERPFQCEVCDKRFNQTSHLRKHLATHTRDRPFQCKDCDKSYTRRCDLKIHLLLHTGERPFKCDVCSMSFARSFTLKEHLRLHTGERPFKCNICDQRFRRKNTYQFHLVKHSGENPFMCEICSKCFMRRGILTRHLRTHNDDMPFQCTACGKRFKEKYQLTSHLRIHSDEKPFKCNVCDKRYKRKCQLETHSKTHC